MTKEITSTNNSKMNYPLESAHTLEPKPLQLSKPSHKKNIMSLHQPNLDPNANAVVGTDLEADCYDGGKFANVYGTNRQAL